MLKNSTAYKILIYCWSSFWFRQPGDGDHRPRLVASLFGSTTVIWAIIISVTLIGISVGYFLGGRVPQKRVLTVLPVILLLNAAWLLAISWLVWKFLPVLLQWDIFPLR